MSNVEGFKRRIRKLTTYDIQGIVDCPENEARKIKNELLLLLPDLEELFVSSDKEGDQFEQ